MPLVERLTLIANQFDLTFRIASDGRSITLIPIPDELTNPRQPSAAEAKAASPESPDGKGDADLDRVHIERLAVREKPIGPVLRQLAERWKLDLQIDEEAIEKAGISMDQRVSVVVENATIDELFRELLKPTGLTFRRSQRTVVLTPAR
jgi:hypothetical protein